MSFERRDFLRLMAAGGGAVLSSALRGRSAFGSRADDFYFVQLSDTHWGFKGPPNPEADVTLGKAVEAVNGLGHAPDFIVFTGDLTHTTDDGKERRARMARFKEIVGGLKTKRVYFMPGEHDASLDAGAAYRELFGDLHYSFDHKGIHFVALDNVSDPQAQLGPAQIDWLAADLKKLDRNAPIVILTHRPLFDLYAAWDWTTRDGTKALEVLHPYRNVTVFYGHIHQEHHHMTEHIAHHAARSLVFPLPPPASQPKRAPVPWDAAHPWRGLGFREVELERVRPARLVEHSMERAATGSAEPAGGVRTVRVTAKKFTFEPSVINLAVGTPVRLELSTLDRKHGFAAPDLGLETEIAPGAPAVLTFTPSKKGTFPFHCSVFCGDGHEDMGGQIVVA